MNESMNAVAATAASLIARSEIGEVVSAKGHYVVECFDADGNLKWADEIFNVVTTVGKNDALDKYLAGSAYTAAFVMGLKSAGTAVAGDTMASHASWTEVGGANAPAYSGNRPTPAFAAASAGSKATSAAVAFTFTSGGTVAGCFLVSAGSATKDNTTGVLLSAGDFSGGNRTVATSDVLNVTWSLGL